MRHRGFFYFDFVQKMHIHFGIKSSLFVSYNIVKNDKNSFVVISLTKNYPSFLSRKRKNPKDKYAEIQKTFMTIFSFFYKIKKFKKNFSKFQKKKKTKNFKRKPIFSSYRIFYRSFFFYNLLISSITFFFDVFNRFDCEIVFFVSLFSRFFRRFLWIVFPFILMNNSIFIGKNFVMFLNCYI